MKNKTLEQIILDWIGEDMEYSPKPNDDQQYIEGANQNLSDLRARVPELVEKLEKLIDEKIGNAIEDYNERNY